MGLRTQAPSFFSTGTTLVTRFLVFILYALQVSQDTQLYIASSMLSIQGRKSVEPPSGALPCLGPAWPKIAMSEVTVMSVAMPIS